MTDAMACLNAPRNKGWSSAITIVVAEPCTFLFSTGGSTSLSRIPGVIARRQPEAQGFLARTPAARTSGRFRKRDLCPDEMEDEVAAVRAIPVLDEVEALPGSQDQLTLHHGNAQGHPGQHGPHMGGHVVRSFRGM